MSTLPPQYPGANNTEDIESGYNRQIHHGNIIHIRPVHYEHEYDNSACLYCAACMSLFIPLIGIVTIFIYLLGCMQANRSEREKTAFSVLVITTIVNLLIAIFVIASQS